MHNWHICSLCSLIKCDRRLLTSRLTTLQILHTAFLRGSMTSRWWSGGKNIRDTWSKWNPGICSPHASKSSYLLFVATVQTTFSQGCLHWGQLKSRLIVLRRKKHTEHTPVCPHCMVVGTRSVPVNNSAHMIQATFEGCNKSDCVSWNCICCAVRCDVMPWCHTWYAGEYVIAWWYMVWLIWYMSERVLLIFALHSYPSCDFFNHLFFYFLESIDLYFSFVPTTIISVTFSQSILGHTEQREQLADKIR